MAERGVLEIVLGELVEAMRPLVNAAEESPPGSGLVRLGREVGVDLSTALTSTQATAFKTAVTTAFAPMASITTDPVGFAAKVPDVVEDLADFVETTKTLDTVLATASDLSERLFNYLVFSYVQRRTPTVHALLVLFGVFQYESVSALGSQPAYLKRDVRWDQFPKLLDPPAAFADLYKWGKPGFDSNLLLERVGGVAWALGIPSSYDGSPSPATDGVLALIAPFALGSGTAALTLEIEYLPQAGGTLPGLAAIPSGMVSATVAVPLGDGWSLSIGTEAAATSGFRLAIRPGGKAAVEPVPGQPTVNWALKVTVGVAKTSSDGKYATVFGVPDAARLEAKAFGVALEVGATSVGGDVGLELEVDEGRLVIPPGEGDSFLQKVFPAGGITVPFDVLLGWSARRGLYFDGSAGLETTFGVQVYLGPLRVDSVFVRLRTLPQGKLGLTAAVTAGVELAVLAVSVDRVGLEVIIDPGPPPQIGFGFSPPTGLGILVEAGPIAGGGFLTFDYANGRYAGILQLEGAGIGITAIGLLDTKLPGGVSGYSFLIIITAKFPPIQLGFGFALTGVGGLAGIHRTIVVDALQDGVRTGSVDHILFPENPIRDAPQIISDLRTIFPPATGRFVFGPMASLIWGTPVVVEAELGIIIQLPSPIVLVLLGQINVAIPEKSAAIVELHIDIAGSIDFGARQIKVDSTIHDSRVLTFSLFGDMAFRLAWGDQPAFALSVGGWHPQFQPPPGFPPLRRLTLALGAGENPRLTFQAYLAVTANSFQVGARGDLYAEAAGFNLTGFVGFDALFIFSPFSFLVELSAGMALKRGSMLIAGVNLDAHLSGPAPWHAWGGASISILFFKVTVGFDATFGEERRVDAIPGDPWKALQQGLEDGRNWTATLSDAAFRVVTITAPDVSPVPVLIDPVGGLTGRQKAVPLHRTLSKFGEAALPAAVRFDVDVIRIGTAQASSWNAVQEPFAPGPFEQMSDSQKLTRSAFERMDAGVSVSSDALAIGSAADVKGADATYETKTIDALDKPLGKYTVASNHLLSVALGGAAGHGLLGNTGNARFAPPFGAKPAVSLDDEGWVVISTADFEARSDILTAPTTKGAAYHALDAWLQGHPHERGVIEVAPVHEMVVN